MKHQIAIALFALALSLPCLSKPVDGPAKPIDNLLKAPPQQGAIDLMAKPSAKDLFDKNHNPENAASFSNISNEALSKLDRLLDAQDYVNLDKFIESHIKDGKMGIWLDKKSNNGHVHLMWFLAEHHSRSNSIDSAVKWSYAAMFGTLQESKLCLDRNIAATAPGLISQTHPNLLRLTRANPFLLKDSKIFAMGVLTKATGYVDPTGWLCMPYATPERQSKGASMRYSYDEVYYPLLRARARNALRETYQIEQIPETPPPMPAKPAPATNASPTPAPPAKP